MFTKEKRLTADNAKELQSLFINSANQAMQSRNKKIELGKYRGFDITLRYSPTNAKDGYRFFLQNEQGKEFTSNNLAYTHDEKMSIGGFFQRLDNVMGSEFDFRRTQAQKLFEREKLELPNAEQALNKPFVQEDELKLVREKHSAVLKELKLMQENKDYVSEWMPKTLEMFRAEKVQGRQRTEITM